MTLSRAAAAAALLIASAAARPEGHLGERRKHPRHPYPQRLEAPMRSTVMTFEQLREAAPRPQQTFLARLLGLVLPAKRIPLFGPARLSLASRARPGSKVICPCKRRSGSSSSAWENWAVARQVLVSMQADPTTSHAGKRRPHDRVSIAVNRLSRCNLREVIALCRCSNRCRQRITLYYKTGRSRLSRCAPQVLRESSRWFRIQILGHRF